MINGYGSTGESVYCGSYKNHAWILRGMYYLEIIVIFCHNFGVLKPKAHRIMDSSEWLGIILHMIAWRIQRETKSHQVQHVCQLKRK